MSDDQKAKACEIKYPTKYVKLNVGGSFFYTTVAILTKHDTLLQSMFNDGQADTLKDSDGCIGIDRCGKHFGTILDFLRDGSISLPDSRKDIAELLVEANYFRVNVLAELCQKILTKEENETELICRVPLVTSSNEAGYLISSTTKPVVKLLINRHNNKYSYTNTSDDNLLRNMELFDKLSLRFKGGVVFIKDVDDISEEICCWSFYKDGINCATVCCTSNVYETDKMYTKVEFPEARINEETDIITRNVVML